MMECTLIFPDDSNANDADIADLWNQGVNMDDWGFILIVPKDQVEEYDATDRDFVGGQWQDIPVKRVRPVNPTLERFEVGCCNNVWYLAKFRGKDVALLVTYHA